MKHCLDYGCTGLVELINGKLRCNKCGIVQDKQTIEDFKKTLTYFGKETREVQEPHDF